MAARAPASCTGAFFDPESYRIVIFDQRGSSRSTPLGQTRGSTAQHLIADIERLRKHLPMEKWIIFGGFGATLARAYAQAHPQCCSALVFSQHIPIQAKCNGLVCSWHTFILSRCLG
ncbi:MAG: alpha/beta fold hydrolase [Betaproteobacteria bacterium]|jgi:pimeloyl-ACP methyl ester carboxylesterase|nr:MAG: alpha/beta fold hydrolase [Betaproteobacteria bacterium]